MFVEECAGAAGLASQFTQTRRKFDAQVGIPIEPAGNFIQMLRGIGDVQSYEGRLWMARDHAIAGGQQLCLRRKILPVEGPVRMMTQLFPAFVEAVGGREESIRIGDVNEDGEA